ncbi:MAG: GDP-mannose 4,6-dehydratase [Gemmatimonadaceae bacterium]|nr:GDP-mannose 4,6-dehydratase [Gemmatimonadaceae bacterium]
MSRALVTGGAGFIGSHVVDRLLAEGLEVHVADSFVTGKRDQVPKRAVLHELDVRDEAMSRVIADLRPEIVVHLAAQMDVRKSVAEPVFDASTNIIGSLNVLEAVRHHAPSSRVVFSSTGGVLYGGFTVPPNAETFPKDPESPYAIAKLSVEYYLAYYARVHGLETVALRFGNVYGPRQDPHGEAGVVAIFCGRLLAGEPLVIFGDGAQTRDYIYVSDVVEATWRAATGVLPPAGRLDDRGFNVGTGEGTSVLRIAELLQRAARSAVAVNHAPARAGELQDSYIEVSKAAELLAWRPLIALDEGLATTYEWFAARAPSSSAATVPRDSAS